MIRQVMTEGVHFSAIFSARSDSACATALSRPVSPRQSRLAASQRISCALEC